MGNEPEFFDGQGGDLSQWRGVGTENQSDTGSPASGIFAAWKQRRTDEPTMPNAENTGEDERQTQETNESYYNMQQR